LRVADSLEQHLDDLAAALRRSEAEACRITGFVGTFVRPHGLDVAATPRLAAAIEELGALGIRTPERVPPAVAAARLALYPVAAAMNVGLRGGKRKAGGKQKAARPASAAAPARTRPSAP
jgi:hypothetical protein